jgi:CO/xanthine dehydrogenase Mo-binding subunit
MCVVFAETESLVCLPPAPNVPAQGSGKGRYSPNPSGAFVELLDDGCATVLTACADMGQGSDTVLAMIAAEELGIDDIEKVKVYSTDTIAPFARGSSASGQTYVTGNAVRLAAIEAREPLFRQVAKDWGVPKRSLAEIMVAATTPASERDRVSSGAPRRTTTGAGMHHSRRCGRTTGWTTCVTAR